MFSWGKLGLKTRLLPGFPSSSASQLPSFFFKDASQSTRALVNSRAKSVIRFGCANLVRYLKFSCLLSSNTQLGAKILQNI